MTWLSFTLYGIWIPAMFNIHFCIQERKYYKMVWRRRRVGKTMQLIRFICFILILASVTSNNHTHMVQCAEDITCQSTSYFVIFLPKYTLAFIMYFVAQSHIIQILIPYLLGFFGLYCRNPHLPLNGSNFSSMQTAEPTKYNDLHKPMNMSTKKIP